MPSTEIPAAELQRCARGDRSAQQSLYDRYAGRVYRTALHVLGQRADAEDAVQDVFLRLFDNVAGFAAQSSFSTWLYRLTVNHCLNVRKRGRRGPEHLDSEAADALPDGEQHDPTRHAERSEARDRAMELLARLSERDRTILVLREIEELSYRDIAAVLEVPEGTVMSRLARARERFCALRGVETSEVK